MILAKKKNLNNVYSHIFEIYRINNNNKPVETIIDGLSYTELIQ